MSFLPTDTAVNSRERTASSGSDAAYDEILVVNRDPQMRAFINKALFVGELSSVRVDTPAEAIDCIRESRHSVMLVNIESAESVELIETVYKADPDARVVAISNLASAELVREVLCTGASDFLFGSIKSQQLVVRLRELLAETKAVFQDREVSTSEGSPQLSAPSPYAVSVGATRIISSNPKTERVLEISRKVAPTDSTVLVQGESGTGKELLARYIHEHSRRVGDVFIEVNCGALPENLLESQLFGHEKGSFTGASQRQLGLFEIANGGTIFLDEIGEMGLETQVKILRVLQSREFRRIGGSPLIRVDVRIIAATNRALKAEVDEGRFRTDLYYRLNVINLELPALRERRDEIPLLVEHFRDCCAKDKGLERKEFTPAAIDALKKFRWDGNIRELENAVERLVLLSPGDVVDVEDLDEHLEEQRFDSRIDPGFESGLTLDEVKKLHVARVLKENGGNKMKTARLLQINVKTLYNLIKNLDIETG